MLVVSGTTIPVAPTSTDRGLIEAVDRASSLDNTYRTSQTGGTRKDWRFSTPPLARATADTYEALLRSTAAQLCSGDLLGLPVMCCAELTGWTPIHISGSHYVVLDFMLHEVQSAKTLLRYVPGDTISGEAFSRSTIATYFDSLGVNQDKAINAKRDGHYGGYPATTVRQLLLEAVATNQILRSSDFSNASWVKSNITPAAGIAGIRSGTSANTLTATASNASVSQFLAAGTSGVRTNSIWARRRTGTGQVELYAPDDSTFTIMALTANFKRFQIPGPATTARKFDIVIRVSGDAIDVENAQLEDGAIATSEIQTTTVAVTKALDSYSLPFTTTPQEMSVYVKFTERGTLSAGGILFQISNAANAAPQFVGYASGGFYRAFHNNGSTTVASTLGTAPVMGDTVELLFRLFGDGSVDITQSLNGAAATSAAQTVPTSLAAAWSGLLVWLNSAGTAGNYGYVAISAFKIIAGSRNLDMMRTL